MASMYLQVNIVFSNAMADSGFEKSRSEEDHENLLSRREVDELIESVINPPSQYRKIRVKRKRSKGLVLHAQRLWQPTDAELTRS